MSETRQSEAIENFMVRIKPPLKASIQNLAPFELIDGPKLSNKSIDEKPFMKKKARMPDIQFTTAFTFKLCNQFET